MRKAQTKEKKQGITENLINDFLEVHLESAPTSVLAKSKKHLTTYHAKHNPRHLRTSPGFVTTETVISIAEKPNFDTMKRLFLLSRHDGSMKSYLLVKDGSKKKK